MPFFLGLVAGLTLGIALAGLVFARRESQAAEEKVIVINGTSYALIEIRRD